MTNITELINKAAKEYGDSGSFQEWLKLPQNKSMGFIEGDYSKTIRCFTAGASFASTDPEMMKAMLKPFCDWLWRSYKQIDAQVWKERRTTSDTVYTLYQVIDKYIQETIKQKQDEKG